MRIDSIEAIPISAWSSTRTWSGDIEPTDNLSEATGP